MAVWCNGAIASETLIIDPSDRGFTLGDGIFETIKWSDGHARWQDRHFMRLRASAEFLAIPLHWSDAQLGDAIAAVVRAEGLDAAAVRLTLTRGPAPRGILPPANPRPTVVVTAGPLPPLKPVTAIIATQVRRNEHSMLSRIKSLCYADNILACREAADKGADQALLLNTAGRIAEAAIANLFIRHGNDLITPPLSEGALPGVMRGVLMDNCRVIERSITPQMLTDAEYAFLSSSIGLRLLTHVDGARLSENPHVLQPFAEWS